jgi:hypothetical protein
MAAIVSDQFRILNASNFVDSISNTANSYYVFLGLPNPGTNPTTVGFGRSSTWNTSGQTPQPVDNIDFQNHYHDTMIFGKKVGSLNVRRLIRRIDWAAGTKYEMYRHDYSISHPSPITNSTRLYDANYYVINSQYKVYICIDNGSSGINTTGSSSQDEPTFTDLEPSKAGESGDGYLWKYLFTVSPSDIIKFDSTDYIAVPNDWSTSSDSQIVSVRQNGDSTLNGNQIKKVYLDTPGSKYTQGTFSLDILGDGTGAKVSVDINSSGQISNVNVSSGGQNYTYGMVDLGSLSVNAGQAGKLIPIIPPSKGHGYDLYKELGADKILVYARFDDSTNDFPVNTQFAQIGILKNPTSFGSTAIFTDNQYSSLYSVGLSSITNTSITPIIGEKITQTITGVGTAVGYVSSYDSETKVIKYIQDRSLYFNQDAQYLDQTDYKSVTASAKVLSFRSNYGISCQTSGFSATINTTLNTNTITVGNKIISLGAVFTNGLANPEINKSSGDIIYIDNRPLIARNSRQKEDVKIILEF